MNLYYPFTIEKGDEHGFIAQFVDIEEAYTFGETIDECIHNASEVLSAVIEMRLENNEPIPEPSNIDTKYKVMPSVTIQAALSIRNAKDDKRMSTADLARVMGVTWPVANKLTDPKHYPNLRQLEKAANALGKRLVVSLV